jgi:hypothetical protein
MTIAQEYDGYDYGVMVAWALDNDENDVITASKIVAESTGFTEDHLGACRVPTDDAEGDMLLAYREYFSNKLQLGAWRSGARD